VTRTWLPTPNAFWTALLAPLRARLARTAATSAAPAFAASVWLRVALT
jgi:hypothetical protein